MVKELLWIAASFWLLSCCRANEVPTNTECFGTVKLSFFCNFTKSFEEAKKVCEKYDGDSNLVKINNANMTKFINSLVNQSECKYPEDIFIGAKAQPHPDHPKNRSEREWKWLDGSEIYLSKENGYQNWMNGQPNDVNGNEDCIILDEKISQWKDSPCHERKYYICETEVSLKIKINDSNPYVTTCVASASSCTANAEWQRNGLTVSKSNSESVYQINSAGKSLLQYENATIGDVGSYICVAWIGHSKTYQSSQSTELTVEGTPTITDVKAKSFSCNASLLVLWKPHHRALGFRHIVGVNASWNREQVKSIEVTPTRNEASPVRTEITGLQTNKTYNVYILACKDVEDCSYATNKTATTLKEILTIKNASVKQQKDLNTCVVTWQWSHNITITSFQVSVYSKTLKTRSFTFHKKEIIEASNIHSFEPSFENIYEVELQAIGNEKFCTKPVKVVGSCIGDEVKTNATLIIVLASGIVVLILILTSIIYLCWKRIKKDQNAQEVIVNPIYDITSNINVQSSDYDQVYATSNQRDASIGNNNELQKYGRSSSNATAFQYDRTRTTVSNSTAPMTINPLYGDIGSDTSIKRENNYALADAHGNSENVTEVGDLYCTAEDTNSNPEAPIYAEIN